ncbi:MAG: DUF5716 family protein [Clostridiales bacterium]|jgi:molecular chaperone DnaK (HSP70)|nr:DUF5716 family protein [Clostridiales bacterium]
MSGFVLGIDIGADSSAVAYYDAVRGEAAAVDISGGYGVPSSPTVVEYANGEWVFGEYALSGGEDGAVFTRLPERLGKGEYASAGGRPTPIREITGEYIRDMIAFVKGADPKAGVEAIVAASPADWPAAAAEDLRAAFVHAGYGSALADIRDARECAAARLLAGRDGQPTIIADFGAGAFRVGLYERRGGFVDCLSSVSYPDLGADALGRAADSFVAGLYEKSAGEPSARDVRQLERFCRSHRRLLLGRQSAKDVKLYVSFAYPPFAMTARDADIRAVTKPFAEGIRAAVTAAGERAAVSAVCLMGGGFEYPFARAAAAKAFPRAELICPKVPAVALAEGACLIAAAGLGLAPAFPKLRDVNRLSRGVGVRVRAGNAARFFPIAPEGAYWWDKFPEGTFLLTEPTDAPPVVEIYSGGRDGVKLTDLTLTGLPRRPAGTTVVGVSLAFSAADTLDVAVRDVGFGEQFPSAGGSARTKVKLETI